jgi:hypothetical protein
MDKNQLQQQNLEDEENDFCSYDRNKVYSKKIQHQTKFEELENSEMNHLDDIIKRSKTSPNKPDFSSSQDSNNKQEFDSKENIESTDSKGTKLKKLKQKLKEHLNKSMEYEIDVEEREFKDQISEKIKKRKLSQKEGDFNSMELYNLKILDSFGGHLTNGNKMPVLDNNMTSLESRLMGWVIRFIN